MLDIIKGIGEAFSEWPLVSISIDGRLNDRHAARHQQFGGAFYEVVRPFSVFDDIKGKKKTAGRQVHLGKDSRANVQGHGFPDPGRGFFVDIHANTLVAPFLQFRQQNSRATTNLDYTAGRGTIAADHSQPVLYPAV